MFIIRSCSPVRTDNKIVSTYSTMDDRSIPLELSNKEARLFVANSQDVYCYMLESKGKAPEFFLLFSSSSGKFCFINPENPNNNSYLSEFMKFIFNRELVGNTMIAYS